MTRLRSPLRSPKTSHLQGNPEQTWADGWGGPGLASPRRTRPPPSPGPRLPLTCPPPPPGSPRTRVSSASWPVSRSPPER